MIIEKRRQVRKSYQNYTATPPAGSSIVLQPFGATNNVEKRADNRKITYFPVNFVSSPADWEDDSALSTETTPKMIVYGFAILTSLIFFAIGYSLYAG